MLAQSLVERGHQVVWWASRFSHFKKKFRADKPGSHELGNGVEMRLVDALGYSKNVSLARLKDHAYVAQQFLSAAEETETPDVVVASYPTIEICQAAASFCKKRKIPLLMDIRDQYPDHYWQAGPRLLRPLIQLGCQGMIRSAREALSAADAITGNGEDVVNFGLRYAGRERTELDKTIYMTYERPEVSSSDSLAADQYWEQHGIPQNHDQFVMVFAGSLGPTSNFDSLVEIANRLPAQVKVVICGDGSAYESLRSAFAGNAQVILTGRVTMPILEAIFCRSQAAYIPYLEVPNFLTGVTNKMVEAVAYGLPVLTTLRSGVFAGLLTDYGAGETLAWNDPEALLKVLERWSADSSAIATMASGSASLYEERLSPKAINRDWAELIERVAARQSG